jgi:hypothetical protein
MALQFSAGLSLFQALSGWRGARPVVDLPQSRIASGPASKSASLQQTIGAFRSPRADLSGPWRVVTDPLSEGMRLPPSGDVWTIVDMRDQVVFTGTKRDCEDWLDYQENIAS